MATWILAGGDFTVDFADNAKLFPGSGDTIETLTSPVLNGLRSFLLNMTSRYLLFQPPPALAAGSASVWGHFHHRYIANNSSAYGFLHLSGETYGHLLFAVHNTGVMTVYRANDAGVIGFAVPATLLGTGTFLMKRNTWYSIQFEVTIHESAGIVKTWINGVPDLNLTGIDTKQASGTDAVTRVYVAGQANFDSFFIGDNSGANTEHPGEVRVDCMWPDANGSDRANGGVGEMTRSAGSDEALLVDDLTALAGIADYIYADAPNERCSLNVAALTNAGGTLLAVQVTVYATKNEPGACGFKIYLLSGGTRYYSDEFFPSWGLWDFYRWIWDQHPLNGAWTEAVFNACEFGVERTT